jgi:hypothetical protein
LSWLTDVPGQNTSSSFSPRDIGWLNYALGQNTSSFLSLRDICLDLLMFLAKTPPHTSPLEIIVLTYWCSWPIHLLIPPPYRFLSWLTDVLGLNTSHPSPLQIFVCLTNVPGQNISSSHYPH